MPKIVSKGPSYENEPCNRCGSKRKISKTWEESIPNLMGGVIIQTHSQVTCKNIDCQKAFDINLAEEKEKREKIRKAKEKSS